MAQQKRISRSTGSISLLLAAGVVLAACQQEVVEEEAAPGSMSLVGKERKAADDDADAYAHIRPGTKVTIEGTLDVVEIDYEDGRHDRALFIVDDATSRRFEVKVPKGKKHDSTLTTGAKVRATGAFGRAAALETSVSVSSEEEIVVTAAAELVAATTMRTALVLLVDFSDGAVSCTDSAVAATMFTGAKNVNAWYQETSGGLLGFDGDADHNGTPDVRRVKISNSVTEACDSYGFASAADSAATAAGITLSNYRHKIYVLPSTVSACGWAGLGNLSCSSCRAWVKTCQYPDVYAHELGHNLGMHHASTDGNNDGVIDSEYGDRSDIMGIGAVGYRHVNAPHKTQMGWFPSSKIASVSGGSYRLAPVELAPSSTSDLQTLKIAKPDTPGTSYFVSYRRALGNYSTNLSTAYSDRVSIHKYSSGSAKTLLVTTLGDGGVFTDSVNGVSISLTSRDQAGANVNVSTTCVANAPSVTFGAATASKAGASATATVTIANRDGAACGSTTFSLAAAVPTGWASSLGATSMALAPGQSGTVTLAMTPPLGVTDGSYPISLSATDRASATHVATGSGSHRVDNTPPSAITNLAGSSSKGKITLTWGVPSDGAGSGVARYRVRRDGAEIGIATSTSFTDTNVTTGVAYAYTVLAEDRAGNVSASSNTATVTAQAGGGKRR